MTELRSTEQRKRDVLDALTGNPGGFLATATDGTPHVIAVSTVWLGETLLLATRAGSRTARNLGASGRVKFAIGSPDDVILVDAAVARSVPASDAPPELSGAFTAGAGWNPAEEGPDWAYFELRPRRIQAYRGYRELEGRDVMRDGRWLA